jgi:hypothetical protein
VAIFLFEFQTPNELEEKEKACEIFVFVGKDQKRTGWREKSKAHLSFITFVFFSRLVVLVAG